MLSPGGAQGRQWYASNDMDLIVWFEGGDVISGFQLCYDKSHAEKALTFTQDKGYMHAAVDNGEGTPGRYKAAPILILDVRFAADSVISQLVRQAGHVDVRVLDYVLARLREYPAQ